VKIFQSKEVVLVGSSYEEVLGVARKEHDKIEKLTKRQPYIRSTYFNKEKVFVSTFWNHIMQKDRKVRFKRLKLYKAAIDLLRNTRHDPETIFIKGDLSTLYHRFYGMTKDGIGFCVQVKEEKRNGRKDFMSVYDRKKP
jgi:hypothetical protein